jgi:hypothetical protein
MIEIDSQVDPIARRRDFEFAVMPDVPPIVAQKHFNYIAVPQSNVRRRVVRGQEQVQLTVWATKKKIEIASRPERFDGGFGLRIFNLPAAILPHQLFRGVLPHRGMLIERERRIAFRVSDLKFRARGIDNAGRLRAERHGDKNE